MLNLSKSNYCTAVQCPKMLWLKNNKPEVFDESVADQARLENGKDVGDLAKSLFGDYVEVPYDDDKKKMIRKTEELIARCVPVIAEASFSYNGKFCSVDILKKTDEGYEIYEVKSSSEIKDIYKDDAAYQNYVLNRCGIHVCGVFIVYINTKYQYSGELDLKQFFNIENVSETVFSKMAEVDERIQAYCHYLHQTEEPLYDIGTHCNEPYKCGCWQYCTSHLPHPNVFDLKQKGSAFSMTKKVKLYQEGMISFEDLMKCDKVPEKQKLKIKHQLSDMPPHIEKDHIQNFLTGLSYPLFFLDFESFQQIIPQYDNSMPYEQITFQYSLHFIESENSELKHSEFLANPGSDPRREVAEHLCHDIPENVCVLAYNSGFEKGRIKRLAKLYPDLAEHLMNIHDNIQDLMMPFEKKYYYTKAMLAGDSIKVVLPALFPNDPELDYHNLEGVHNGSEASETFAAMPDMSQEELELRRQQLLKYCGLDTLAMVKIWQKLKEVSANG